jgi:hypothetical protein
VEISSIGSQGTLGSALYRFDEGDYSRNPVLVSTGNVLTVSSQRNFNRNHSIRFEAVNSDGQVLISANPIPETQGRAEQPHRLIPLSSGYLMAWVAVYAQEGPARLELRLARLDSNGRVVGEPSLVRTIYSETHALFLGFHALAAGHEGGALVWTEKSEDEERIEFLALDPAGIPAGEPVTVRSQSSTQWVLDQASLLPTIDGYVIAWEEWSLTNWNKTILIAKLDRTGGLTGEPIEIPSAELLHEESQYLHQEQARLFPVAPGIFGVTWLLNELVVVPHAALVTRSEIRLKLFHEKTLEPHGETLSSVLWDDDVYLLWIADLATTYQDGNLYWTALMLDDIYNLAYIPVIGSTVCASE